MQTVGIHPQYIYNIEEQEKELTEAVKRKEIVAIGEAGLDKSLRLSIETQKKLFITQARLAESTGKPLIIHCVRAWNEIIDLHKLLRPSVAWIAHGFRGKPELATQLLKHDFYLSFGLKFNPDTLAVTPYNRLFAETDASGASIKEAYSLIASAMQTDEMLIAEHVKRNVSCVFNV
jgi:TatD DNase family protein